VRAFSLLGRTGPGCRLHHNLVKRTRQMGLVGADLLSHNEVYVDGWTRTGARALAAGPGGVVRRNRVFGTGLAVEALVAGTDGAVGHNFVHLEGIDTGKNRDPRKRRGAGDTMVGLRVDPGRAGPGRAELLCGDNTIVIGCRGGSEGRGLWLSSSGATAGLVCRDCTVKVRARDDKTDRIACVLADGPAGNDAPPPVRYRDCTLISNVCCVRLGGGRDGARGFEFDRCRLRRIGQDQRFHTLVAHGPARVAQTTLRDCRFGPGAAPDDVLWDKASPDSACRVVWTLTLRAPPGAEVAVKDSGHAAVFEGRVGPTGVIDVPLTGCVLGVKAGDEGPEPLRNARTPHAVTVSLDGKTTSRTVDMTGPRDITLTP